MRHGLVSKMKFLASKLGKMLDF